MSRLRGRPRGWRSPNARRVMINVRLTAAEAAAVDARCARDGLSRSDVLRAAFCGELAPLDLVDLHLELRELRTRLMRLELRLPAGPEPEV